MTNGVAYLDGRVTLHAGDCLEVIRGIPDASIDSVVTDPPYVFASIQERFGKKGSAPAQYGTDGVYARAAANFLEQDWDTGDVVFSSAFWSEVLRVLKPGGNLVAFGGTKTYHRLASSIEGAEFEIRDMIQWLYGQGFPKSHSVQKGVDRVRGRYLACDSSDHSEYSFGCGWSVHGGSFAGLGTALKPACEPIALARRGLIGTVAENVLRYGTGALNIAGCHNGRWPPNVLHDGSSEVVESFPEGAAGLFPSFPYTEADRRFMFCGKADADDRAGGSHPTVKPLRLMQWLIRLVTPPGGTVLDPFAGSGTTGEAAFREGMRAVLIEREESYREIITRRMALAQSGPDGRRHAILVAKGRVDYDPGPLFEETK